MISTTQLLLHFSSEIAPESVLAYELQNREFFTAWVPEREERWFSLEFQKKRLQAEALEEEARRSLRLYITLATSADVVVGDISLSNVVYGVFRSAALGYKVDQRYEGQGIMKQALVRVIAYARDDLHLHRLEANIIPRNDRSIARIQSLGFDHEGYSRKFLCINGKWEDHERYALIL